MRGEWIEIECPQYFNHALFGSLPMRGEWIEILSPVICLSLITVSPHAGRVD